MGSYLKKLCINLGIELIYTNNKITILSADVKNGIPVIRANKLFKDCSYKVAQSVVGFYTEIERRTIHKSVIEEYIKKYYKDKDKEFKIKLFNLKQYITLNTPEEKIKDVDDIYLQEYDVFYMTVNGFLGEERNQGINGEIEASEDDLLELNIIVKPPVT